MYYSYTVHDDIALENGSNNQISSTDVAITERLMSNLSEHFSPTLFQPPAALHMECTDVYAGLWMERAVQPAFTDNGTANPFFTLKRLSGLDWKRETDPIGNERSEPCNECQQHMKTEWETEALSIWDTMDTWLEL